MLTKVVSNQNVSQKEYQIVRKQRMETMRIWIIDASRITRKILEVTLKRVGHQVSTYADPVEAIRHLHSLADGLPDIACVAARLPKMAGYKVIHGLHKHPRYRHIALIGLLTEEDGYLGQLKMRIAGARRLLVKPLYTEEVLAALSAVSPAPQHETIEN